MVFPVVMNGCESWTINKAECWRTDAFELLCWRRLLRVPWTARRSNQSILKEISPGGSLEGLMLKLKLQYFGQLMWRADSFFPMRPWCYERLKAGGEGDDRGWDGWMASPTPWTWIWVSSGCWWWTGRPGVLRIMGSQRVEHDWVTELNWTDSSFQWYLTLCDPMDCITPGSSVHGILQERILEWVAIPFSRGSSLPRGYTWVSCMAGRFFTVWATREAQRLRWPCNRHLNQVHRQIDLKYDGGKTQLAKQSTKGIFMAF